jgi:hypothetical protein
MANGRRRSPILHGLGAGASSSLSAAALCSVASLRVGNCVLRRTCESSSYRPRELNGDKMTLGIKIILSGFINDPNKPSLRCPVVRNNSVDSTQSLYFSNPGALGNRLRFGNPADHLNSHDASDLSNAASTARAEFNTLTAMRAPCSVKAYGKAFENLKRERWSQTATRLHRTRIMSRRETPTVAFSRLRSGSGAMSAATGC